MHTILFSACKKPLRSMGVAKLATLFRDRGWHADVLDFADDWTDNELEEAFQLLCRDDTLMIGLSSNFIDRAAQRNIVQLTKKYAPNAKIVSGGQAHTTRNEDMGFDLIITSYVDNAIDDLISYILTDDINSLKGIEKSIGKSNCWYLDASKWYPSQNIKDLAPRYIDSDVIDEYDYLGIEFARGCRFKCKFCNYPFLGIKENTAVSNDEIYTQLIKNYEKWGVTNYIINDSTFNDRTEKLELLADIVQKLPFEINFSAYIRIDLLARFPEQVALLAKSRVWAHWYGIETFHPDAAKAIGKGMPSAKIKEAMLSTKDYFLNELGLFRGHSSLIAGLPYEPTSSWKETEDWHKENWNTESRFWFSLELPDEQAPDVEQSVFTKSLSNYNFDRMTDIDRLKELVKNDYRTANYSMPWKHEHADLLDAWLFKKEFDKNILMTLPVDNFSVIPLTKTVDKKELLFVNNSNIRNFIPKRKYIERKLEFIKRNNF